jgi:hypothetical protein
MDIIIKNVTGKEGNVYMIMELSRSGFPAGSIVRNVERSATTNACYWSRGNEHCVGYLGETCEEIPSENTNPKSSNKVRYLVINDNLYEVPEKTFIELEKVMTPKKDFKPEDIPEADRKTLKKLEEIMMTCPVKLKLEAVYETDDFW